MPRVSVIMPVYNSENYLNQAIDSILRQEFPDFELILVDDGSTDLSPAICDGYASKDPRVKVLHQQNGGICRARNAGMAVAKGDYLAFSDNDDAFLPGLLDENYALARKSGAEVVRFGRERITTKNGRRLYENRTTGFAHRVIPRKDFGRYFEEISNTGYGIWTGLYQREFLVRNKITFDESIRAGFEDCLFNLQCYAKCSVMALNPKPYYQWMQRLEHSTSARYQPNVISSIVKCVLFEQKLVRALHVEEKSPGVWQQILTYYYLFFIYNRIGPNVHDISVREKRAILRSILHDARIDFSLTEEDRAHLKKKSMAVYLFRWLFDHGFVWAAYCLYHTGQKAAGAAMRMKHHRERVL